MLLDQNWTVAGKYKLNKVNITKLFSEDAWFYSRSVKRSSLREVLEQSDKWRFRHEI